MRRALGGSAEQHPLVLRSYADYALDAGRIEDATARYAAADAGYRKRADTPALTLAQLEDGVGVHIALAPPQGARSRDRRA